MSGTLLNVSFMVIVTVGPTDRTIENVLDAACCSATRLIIQGTNEVTRETINSRVSSPRELLGLSVYAVLVPGRIIRVIVGMLRNRDRIS